MTEAERGRIAGGAGGDEDRLPWLEPADTQIEQPGVGAGKLAAAVIVVLLAIGLVVGGVVWLRDRDAATDGNGSLIAAPAGDYKVAPGDPGGMDVEGEGDATYAASQGVPVDAAIDISKRPEAPVALPRGAEPAPAAPATPPATPAAPPATPAPVRVAETPPPAPKPAEPAPAKGVSVQLGAFGSEAKAQAAWRDLAGRFPALGGLGHGVTLAEVGGKTLYRLRATAGSRDKAATVCRALTRAKEQCAVIG